MSEDLNKRQAAVEKIGCRAAELTFDWLCGEFEDLPNKLAEDMSVKVTENIIWALGEGSTIDDFADAEQQVSDLRSRLQAAGERATKAEAERDEALERERWHLGLLREMRDLVKDHPNFQKRDFVSLGIAVNNALLARSAQGDGQ